MTDAPAPSAEPQPPAADAVQGGGPPSAAEQLANDPIYNAAAKLELLSEETREQVLARMDPTLAQRIRDHIASQPANRPHGQFSTDVATRRRMISEMSHSVSERTAAQVGRQLDALAPGATMGHGSGGTTTLQGGAPLARTQPAMTTMSAAQPPQPAGEPLDELRTLHPAAIARAMQGERAEAWAIVLDRLDVNARAALQLYLDGTARQAIEDARARQAELQATSPALLGTVVAAIARTVVPRAMREHHQLLTTTPMAWSGT